MNVMNETIGQIPEPALRTIPQGGLVAALAFFAVAAASLAAPPEPLVLENAALRAEVVPAWAGRLLFFGRPGGPNLLWTDPGAPDVPEYVDGRRQWRNFGGEKTWVGTQEEVWPLFAKTNRDGTVWPPPAWFDTMPLSVVRADATNILLRSGIHGTGDASWQGAIEREFTLFADRLEVRERLVLPEGAAGVGETPKPDDPRRIWSVTQVPRPGRVALRLCGDRRTAQKEGIPEPVSEGDSEWRFLDVATLPGEGGKMDADADALAASLPDGTGWLVIRQLASPRHLSAFASPGRAMVYVSPKDWRPSPYIELEFAAYGADAAHALEFRLLQTLPPSAISPVGAPAPR